VTGDAVHGRAAGDVAVVEDLQCHRGADLGPTGSGLPRRLAAKVDRPATAQGADAREEESPARDRPEAAVESVTEQQPTHHTGARAWPTVVMPEASVIEPCWSALAYSSVPSTLPSTTA